MKIRLRGQVLCLCYIIIIIIRVARPNRPWSFAVALEQNGFGSAFLNKCGLLGGIFRKKINYRVPPTYVQANGFFFFLLIIIIIPN